MDPLDETTFATKVELGVDLSGMAPTGPGEYGPDQFNTGYFKTLYVDEESRVTDERYIKCHATAVLTLLNLWGCSIETVLDLGCGPGYWREICARFGASYFGVDFSPDSGADLQADIRSTEFEPHDLVVCQAVTQYLSSHHAEHVMKGLQKWATKAFVFMSLTEDDVLRGVTTDSGQLFMPSAQWYRRQIDRRLWREVITGVWVKTEHLSMLELGS